MATSPPVGPATRSLVLDIAARQQVEQLLIEMDREVGERASPFEESVAALEPLLESIRQTETLSEADFAIRINTKD
jgi:hypothetical protein